MEVWELEVGRWKSSRGLRLEPRVHRDGCVQYLRHGTAALRVVGCRVERALVRARDLRHDIQMYGRDGESTVRLVERHGGRGLDLLRCDTRISQLSRQRHGETARVRRGNQFLGIRPFSVLEPSAEGILGVGQNAAVSRYDALAVLQTTSPHC